MNLKKFIAKGFLIECPTDKEEIVKLMRLAERDIKEASQHCHEIDWQFAIAYNAALQLASIVVRFVRKLFRHYEYVRLPATVHRCCTPLWILNADLESQ